MAKVRWLSVKLHSEWVTSRSGCQASWGVFHLVTFMNSSTVFQKKKSRRWSRCMGNQEKERLSHLCVFLKQGRNIRNKFCSPTSLIFFLLPCSVFRMIARSCIRVLPPDLSSCCGEDRGGSRVKPSSVLMEQSEWSVENCNNLSSVNNLLFKNDRLHTVAHFARVCLFSLLVVGIFSRLSEVQLCTELGRDFQMKMFSGGVGVYVCMF